MKQRYYIFIRNFIRHLRSRTFLIRLLVTTLIAATIPLTIVSVRMVQRESQYVQQSAEDQLRITAATATSQFDVWMNNINSVNTKLMLSPVLYESVLSGSVENEMQALDLLEYYRTCLPFVKNYILFYSSSQSAYTLTGKFRLSGLLANLPGLTQDDLFDMLTKHSEKPGFVDWVCGNENIIYIAPIRTMRTQVITRYVIYILTPDTIRETMRSVLADHYAIVSITDPAGTPIYVNSDAAYDNPRLLFNTTTGSSGYTLTLCVDLSSLQQNINSLTHSSQRLAALNIFLCVVLIVLVAVFNYRPLALLIRSIRGSTTRSTPELDSIMISYASLAEEKSQLTYQLYERNMMIADRIMENLLSGRKVSPGDLRILRLDKPFYCVVCAPLTEIKNVVTFIERNTLGAPIYAIEMYADNYLALVCGFNEDITQNQKSLIDTIRSYLNNQTTPLGYSTLYDKPDHLFMAYLEACHALRMPSEIPDHFPIIGNSLLIDENSQEIDTLAAAVKSGDAEVITYAERTFARIMVQSESDASQRYAVFQTIDLYRRLYAASGIILNKEQLSLILQQSDLTCVRDSFLSLLESTCTEQLNNTFSAAESTRANLMEFINGRFADPDFDMNDIAEYMGVSIYTASRMLKTFIGISFRKYVNDLRIERAKDLLLTTDLSIADVALQSGFASASYFFNIFKKTENNTPTAYRKQHTIDS